MEPARVRGGLFQAALPGAILCVVELSTLKVRIPVAPQLEMENAFIR
jgi:hypothetical protein